MIADESKSANKYYKLFCIRVYQDRSYGQMQQSFLTLKNKISARQEFLQCCKSTQHNIQK